MNLKKPHFDPVDPRVSFPSQEEEVLKYWRENKIFEKSVENRPLTKTWTFLDGPPFITGLPHYGTLLSSIPKDVFPRFWTMKGYRVRRVWGWDCHGLPAENKVENKLGIKRKKDIEEKVGVKKFIDECKLYVSEVSSEWEWYIDHIARWVDFKNAYRTMDTNYMESVMWVFKQMYDKELIYKGLRVSLFCPHCSTPISNFEVAMDADNYKEIEEKGTTYKYKVKGENNLYFLAWSTTPWNKIVTPALAVNPKIKYIEVEQETDDGKKERYILAEETQKMLGNKPFEIKRKIRGSELVNTEFEVHYDFYKADQGKKIGVVIPGDFVTSIDGTGIVTIAAYGEDDLKAMQDNNIQIYLHVDEEGIVKNEVPKFGGKNYLDVNQEVDADLEERGLVYNIEPYKHTVPTCWRCHTRLFYSPQNAWYVDVQKLRPQLVKNNNFINWFPEHFKMGRFLKSIEAAPDWCISRSRYWGSPVPVWECANNHRFVPGSINELEEKSGRKINDLHKPEIDEVVVKCNECGENMKRVSEVLDSWIEAGSASFAERHFPFDETQKLEDFFPPDFIVEYTGQIRAWFYVLHVISTALYDSISFKNVLVTGVILGTDGRKMSKNYGNYPDPREMITKYGGDALRLYLLNTPVMKGEDTLISEEKYSSQIREFMLIYWNIYNFFVTYANLNDFESSNNKLNLENVLDKWIITSLSKMAKDYTLALENYDTSKAIELLKAFLVNDFSGWYIRRSRDRMNNEFFSTCYFVLCKFSQLSCPVIPFLSEVIYRNLTKEESVHLSDWPEINEVEIDEKFIEQMNTARKICEKAHSIRKDKNIALKQPLLSVTVNVNLDELIAKIVIEEINVKNYKYQKSKSDDEIEVELDTNLTEELLEEAKTRELIRSIQQKRKELNARLDQEIIVNNDWYPKNQELVDWIKKKTYARELKDGLFGIELL